MKTGPDLEHPANATVLKHLARNPSRRSGPPESFDDPYYTLGNHPDLVELLWDKIPAKLPKPRKARWVVGGCPALFNPGSGIIFGFAAGTHALALRLPKDRVKEAISAGAYIVHAYSSGESLDLATIGAEWLFAQGLPDAATWCCAAYDAVGSQPFGSPPASSG